MTDELRVLLVEDSPTDAKLVIQELRRTGRSVQFHRVQTAETMRAALESQTWDVVISDWSMPKFSATAALAVLKAKGLDLPFLIVSGTIGEETAVEGMRAGAHDYVLKDRLARLLPAVEREIRECKERAEHLESEARRVAMLESALDAIVGMSDLGVITEFNPAAERVFGYSRAQALNRPLADLLIPESMRDAHRTGLRKHLVSGVGPVIGKRIEVTALRRDGTEFPAELAITRIESLPRASFMGFIRDISERKQAEQARAEIEARYRRIVETTNQGVWLIDTEGKTQFMNKRMMQLLGCEGTEVRGLSPMEFLDEEGRTDLFKGVGDHRSGRSSQSEARFFRKDGTYFWSLLESSAMLDSAGRYEGSFAMVMDITDRREAEAAQRASEARFRCLWESGIILITISDTNGHIFDINEAGARMLGYSREEFLARGAQWYELTPDEWKQADALALSQLIATGAAAPWEKELLRKDGTRLPVLVGGALLQGSEGIAVGVDLTQQKVTERALLERMQVASLTADVGISLTHAVTLRETLQRCVEAIVRHLGVAFARVWTLNEAARILELEASAGIYTHIDGAHSRVPVGKFKIGLIAQERRAHLTNDVLNDPLIGDPDWARREGMRSFVGHPLLVNEKVVGVMAMFGREPLTDVALKGLESIADAIAIRIRARQTEDSKVALENQLRQAQKMEAVGRLAGGVAHDFNNVLSVILSYSEFILADLKAGDPLRADVQEISTAASRAAGLTRQLLTFSRQEVVEAKVIDLHEVLTNMERMIQRLLGEDVEMVLIAPKSTGRVKVDPSHIEQVIMNLVVNARDAMPTGGKLSIELANVVLDADYAYNHLPVRAGPYLILAVSDTGIGMDRETQARIFEPFFTTKDKGKGTGLGLSTVFGIVQQSGGSIWVYSEPGRGTTFKVYLPRVDEEVDVPKPQIVSTTLRGTETVLLVEDEEQVRAVVLSILRRQGYRVLVAQHAGEALLLCERHPEHIDLLLTDVVMPQMSGPELAKRLGATRPTMKVLCMSGYTDDSIIRHGVLEAGVAFLQKPVTPAALTKKVREVLDNDRASTRMQSPA